MAANQTPLPLRIKLFGSVEVEVDGEPLPKLRSRNELWLLALLALQDGRPVTRSWLAQTLWPFPDHATDQAGYNLRRGLTNLRKALGTQAGRLRAVPSSSLSLDLSGASVDAAAFDAAIAARRRRVAGTCGGALCAALLLECTGAVGRDGASRARTAVSPCAYHARCAGFGDRRL